MSPTRVLAIAALAASLGIPAAAFAQTTPAPAATAVPMAPAGQGGHHHRSRFMAALRSLNLSDAQKQQINAAIAQTRQANQNADPQTRRANMQKLRTQIDGILTPDQRTQLQAQLRQERNEREHGGVAPSASPAPHA